MKRDEFETRAFQQAQSNHIPVLGICRGLQLVNCILEGDLEQDLGDDANRTHKAENKIDKIHEINIQPGSLLNEITGLEKGEVNSAHHQRIKTLGKGLKVNSLSADQSIEGFEWENRKDKPFLLCVQWHPERMEKQDAPLSRSIRDRFIEAIKQSKDKV
jgi:putative glutamine amidotransferase